jgi:hypothetical protein
MILSTRVHQPLKLKLRGGIPPFPNTSPIYA